MNDHLLWQILALWTAVLLLIGLVAHRRTRERTLRDRMTRHVHRVRTTLTQQHLQQTYARLASDANDMVDEAIALESSEW